MNSCIILANGKAPSKSVISYLMDKKHATLFCADGGANTALKLGLLPLYIIGDLDSIYNETISYYQGKSRIIRLSGQNDTDVEKCLKEAIKLKFDEAFLVGVSGDRLDHTFCNLGIAIKFFGKINIKIIAENSILTVLKGSHKLKTIPEETISIYGIDDRTKITSRGLKYPLKNLLLPFGKRESTSNIAVNDHIELKVTSGVIFVIRDFQVMRKHGFI